jgi:hypothetical protein
MNKILARSFSLITLMAGFSVLLLPGLSHAQGIPTMLGKLEYRTNCATCHGEEGKGDGPMADQLTAKPADLQMISQQNDGKFPTDKIYQIIDGRETVRAHGTSDMPVWGAAYSKTLRSMWGWQDSGVEERAVEAAINGRILALVYYLQSIQAE